MGLARKLESHSADGVREAYRSAEGEEVRPGRGQEVASVWAVSNGLSLKDCKALEVLIRRACKEVSSILAPYDIVELPLGYFSPAGILIRHVELELPCPSNNPDAGG